MKRYMLSVLVVAIGLAGNLAAGGKGKTDKDKLQGAWNATKGEKSMMIQFQGDKWSIVFDGKDRFEGSYKIDSTKKPTTLDMKVEKITAKEDKYAGKTALAIIEVTGDTLKWCANEPGRETRPAAFTDMEGEMRYLNIVFTRAKK